MTEQATATQLKGATPNTAQQKRPRWQVWGIRLLAGWLTLCLLLWLGGPPLLKRVLPWAVAQKLPVQLSVGDIRINPLKGELALQQLRIQDGRETLVAAEQIRVNLSLASLWRGSISLDDIALIGPEVNAVINPAGELNLLKLVPPSDPNEPPSNLRWAIDHFLMDQGKLHFRDEQLKPVVDVRLVSSRIEVRDLRSYASEEDGSIAFSTRLDDDTELTWDGRIDLKNLSSQGKFSLANLPLTRVQAMLPEPLPLTLSHGQLALQLPYQAEVVNGQASAKITKAALQLRDLSLRLPRQLKQPLFDLPTLDISQIDVAWPAQTVHIGKVSAAAAALQLRRDNRGNLPLLQALAQPGKRRKTNAADAAAAGKPAAETTTPAKPWQLTLDQLVLTDWAVHWRDAGTQPAMQATLDKINISTGPLLWPAPKPLPLQVSAQLQQGRIAIDGEVDIEQPAISLNLNSSALPLTLAQPYLAQQLAIELKQGTAASELQLKWDPKAGVRLTGNAGIQQLNILNRNDHTRLLAAQRLQVNGLDLQLERHQLRINNIDTDGLFGQVLISPDHQLNLAQLAIKPNSTAITPPPASTGASAKPMSVRIDTVKIRRSAMLFGDQSMTPGFATGIEKLEGRITGLDSRDVASAKVDIKGIVSPSGEVSIRGQMNPLASDLSLDMALQFRQLELSSLTPYAARFAGYRIDRGKLDLDLNYQIQKRQLKAQNKVVLRQLRLGEKVDSPESIGLPLKLAVAILRDVDDNIDIDLPLSGSLDNPEFSIGPIIWQAFVNLLQRAITAPFSVLGNLIGGDGGSLGEVPFPVGSSELSTAARDNLGKLEKVLSSRPALQLEVRGLSDAKADRAALQRQKVDAAVAQRLQAHKDTRIEALEYLLRQAQSRSAVNALRELSQVPAPNGKMELNEAGFEARLIDALAGLQPVSDNALNALAQQRGQAIVAALLESKAVAAERVFLLDQGQGDAKEGMLVVPLKLTTP
jgi:outer membrane protein OmpA-like peptidoglycan-associated protein